MASITEAREGQRASAEASASISSRSSWKNPATRTDVALLASAMFLPRFTLPYHSTFLQLDLLFTGGILLHEFLVGRLLIQYDRLVWFLLFVLANTCSLLLNFDSKMLTGYLRFTVFYALFTLMRRSTADQYTKTLQAFQFLVLLLSCLAVIQFVAQFVVDGNKLMNFYGVVPPVLFSDPSLGMHDTRTFGNMIRSNAFFLPEPSALGELTGLGILIEVLVFGRLKYLLVMALGFLTAYSGTGLIFLSFLPLACLRRGRTTLSVLLVIVFALGLVAMGIVDVSAFSSRVSEFDTPGTSGYARFISPFLLASRQFHTVSLAQLFIGSGPGTIKYFSNEWVNVRYSGGFAEIWDKILYEYGIIGSFIFVCFLTACLRRSHCPGILRAAIIIVFVFCNGGIPIPLCTLNARRLQDRLDEASQYGRPLAAASGSG